MFFLIFFVSWVIYFSLCEVEVSVFVLFSFSCYSDVKKCFSGYHYRTIMESKNFSRPILQEQFLVKWVYISFALSLIFSGLICVQGKPEACCSCFVGEPEKGIFRSQDENDGGTFFPFCFFLPRVCKNKRKPSLFLSIFFFKKLLKHLWHGIEMWYWASCTCCSSGASVDVIL